MATARGSTGPGGAGDDLSPGDLRGGPQEDGFHLLFASNPQPMWVYDLESLQFLEVNTAAVHKYGYSREEFLGMRITDIRPAEELPMLEANLAVPRAELEASREWRHRLKDGRIIYVDIASHQLVFAGRIAVLVLALDITERKRLDEALRHQAFHDSLTGLANRALFRDRIEHALAQRPRSRGECAVLIVDLDGFKLINDAVGHTAGDSLLTEVADRLVACMRPDDTAARLSSDEFGVLLEHVAGVRDAVRVTERILTALQRPVRIGGEDWMVSASVGIATSDHIRTANAEELVRNADVAMYSAKANGRGR
ncbi:MAG: diguanylate cyclase, partial [Candidatus Dormibacteraeota bacterium]|nr:diguanylate cyclase [Candidatus Dormibacteraeota bacterium]